MESATAESTFAMTEQDCNKPAFSRMLVPIAAMFSATVILCVHAPAQVAAAAQSFDVASIHINNTETDGHHHIISDPTESRFRTVNLALRDLIQFAYGVPDSQILGGPTWLDSIMFDIDAKSDAAVDAELRALPAEQARHQKQLMVQELLADRFQLKVHQETRQLPVYALVIARDGPKFKPSKIDGTTIDAGRARLHVAGSDDTVNILARELAQVLGRVVVNRTGLKGSYDLNLRWTPDDAAASASSSSDTPPDIFTAIQEQLGLKLESTKGSVPVLVVDSIEKPSPN
jgi:uncharacterized protein (TIGR03435 family)